MSSRLRTVLSLVILGSLGASGCQLPETTNTDDATLAPSVAQSQAGSDSPPSAAPTPTPTPTVVVPSGTKYFMYATNLMSHTVSVYELDVASGDLRHGTTYPTDWNPSAVAVHPNGRFLYITNRGSNTVLTYEIQASTGALTQIDRDATGSAPNAVTIHPGGRLAYVTNDSAQSVTAYTIHETTGQLTVGPTAAMTGGRPQKVVIHPNGLYAYIPQAMQNMVIIFTINPTTGALGFWSTAGTSPGPSAFVFSHNGSRAYIAGYNMSTVRTYSVNATTGTLSVVSTSTHDSVSPTANGLALDPTGRYLFATTDHSGVNAIYFNLDPITGAAYYGPNGVVAGSRPRSPVADPSGRFVYFANQLSNTIARYEIGVSGEMSNPVSYPTGTQPYGMILAEIPQN